MSIFSNVEQAPAIEVFALSEACKSDASPNKVNLTVGAYRTDEGKPWVLPVVRTVESQMAADETLDKEYLPITGLPAFSQASLKLLLGEGNPVIANNLADGVQTLGGTGAIYLALQFLRVYLKKDTILVSKPTWPNHKSVAKLCGYPNINEYTYWDAAKRGVDFEGMKKDFMDAPNGSVVILHACAHNPTGMDLTKDNWTELSKVFNEKGHFPIFDIAYQGFASGDLDNDAWSCRKFAELGFELFCCQSYSKNFGLYNERVGHLTFITKDAGVTGRVKSQLKTLIRQTWSNPPSHGCRIVSSVLNNPALYAEWKENVKSMADRVKLMRQKLFEKLRSLGTPGTWNHVIEQIGMFSYTGLNKRQVEYLRTKYHIYMLSDGRINMCGLTTKTVEYVATSIHDAVVNVKDDPAM